MGVQSGERKKKFMVADSILARILLDYILSSSRKTVVLVSVCSIFRVVLQLVNYVRKNALVLCYKTMFSRRIV